MKKYLFKIYLLIVLVILLGGCGTTFYSGTPLLSETKPTRTGNLRTALACLKRTHNAGDKDKKAKETIGNTVLDRNYSGIRKIG